MEALVPAFLLALLSQPGDRPPLLAAILADRTRRPGLVLAAAILAHAGGNIVAALLGATLTHSLTPEAKSLLLAVALLFGGVTGFWPAKAPSRMERVRLGAFGTALLGLTVLAFGERTQFFTLALSTGGDPWFAAAGAILGASVVSAAAVTFGESAWSALPLRSVRIATATLFVCVGVAIGLGALRLV